MVNRNFLRVLKNNKICNFRGKYLSGFMASGRILCNVQGATNRSWAFSKPQLQSNLRLITPNPNPQIRKFRRFSPEVTWYVITEKFRISGLFQFFRTKIIWAQIRNCTRISATLSHNKDNFLAEIEHKKSQRRRKSWRKIKRKFYQYYMVGCAKNTVGTFYRMLEFVTLILRFLRVW